MKLPVLASVILFILVLGHRIRLQNRTYEKSTRSFWEREAIANSTRRKSLENLDYIEIPFDSLPCDCMADDERVADCLSLLRSLSTQKIVNLTGFTNTDLKLEYGAPNITELSEYDQNYTVLVRTLQKWADLLWEKDHRQEACAVMEFAVSTHTDISRTYYKLAEYYTQEGRPEEIERLIRTAGELRSASKNAILRTLENKTLS